VEDEDNLHSIWESKVTDSTESPTTVQTEVPAPCAKQQAAEIVSLWQAQSISREIAQQRLLVLGCTQQLLNNYLAVASTTETSPSTSPVGTLPQAPSTGGSASKRKIDLHKEKEFFFSIEQWDQIDLDTEDNDALIGTPQSPIIRPATKNLIEAPEKSFKTTLSLRQLIAMACGYTVFPSLPIARAARILYMHGEMTAKELKGRRDAAQTGIPLDLLTVGRRNFIDGRSVDAHLIRANGQDAIRRIVKKFNPDVLVIDPLQSFISGHDENSFKEMSQAHDFLDKLIVEQNGMTLFLVVHVGKDASRGMRGHSSTAGWRDTLIRLTRKGNDGKIEVDIRPRWASPIKFSLKFQNGTMVETDTFSPQTTKIRDFVQKRLSENGGKLVPYSEIEKFLGTGKEAVRKAIQRAKEEGAISEGINENKGKYGLPVELDEI
jgi:AAA domain